MAVEAGYLSPGITIRVTRSPIVVLAADPVGNFHDLAIDREIADETGKRQPD